MNKRVAVLDSGINNFMDIDLLNQKSLRKIYPESTHGSKVIATIKKYCNKNIKFYFFDIFNTHNQTSAIIKALAYFLFHDVSVIVMSFTLSSHSYRRIITFLLLLLHKKGVIMVAAANEKNRDDSFPASSKYVIGVGDEESILCEEFVQIRENVKPEFVYTGKTYHLFSGTSKANAIAAARILNRNDWKNTNEIIVAVNREGKKQNFDSNNGIEAYKNIYINCLAVLGWSKDQLLFNSNYNLLEIENIILKLLDTYDITEKCLDMRFDNMRSIEEIAKYIGNCLYEKK